MIFPRPYKCFIDLKFLANLNYLTKNKFFGSTL